MHLFAFASETELALCKNSRLNSICSSVQLYRCNTLQKAAGLLRRPDLPVTAATRASGRIGRDIMQAVSRLRPAFASLEWTHSLQYVSQLRQAGCPTFIVEHDLTYLVRSREASVISSAVRSALLHIEAARLRRWELGRLALTNGIVSPSASDIEELRVRGIGVPFCMWSLPYRSAEAYPEDRREETIVFWGAMDREENIGAAIWFAKRVLPKLIESHPKVLFLVIGSNPAQRVLGLESPNLKVTGRIEDPSSMLGAASMMVAPLTRGGGLKVKVLEGMGHGIPCVLSAIAAEGIGGRSGVTHMVADTEADFVSACNQLLAHRELREALGRAGYAHVKRTFDWRKSLDEVAQFYCSHACARSVHQ